MTAFSGSSRVQDEYLSPLSSYQLLVRLRIENRPGNLGRVASAVGSVGASVGAIEIAEARPGYVMRDMQVACRNANHARAAVLAIQAIPGVEVIYAADRTFQLHHEGKIEVRNKIHLRGTQELAQIWSPGAVRVAREISEHPDAVWSLTSKANTVAVVTDGTAVLGLGDIGPAAAMPVMEGKCMLFKTFGGVDAWPICLDTTDPDRIVATVKAIAPGFGAILLEDISAPRCFEIEERLKAELDIPVFHDDQHGTAVVVLAAVINGLKLTGKRAEDLRVVLVGTGAAGLACARILINFGVRDIVGFDRFGAIYEGRTEGMSPGLEWFAQHSNREDFRGSIGDALVGADLFLGLSRPRVVSADQIASMAPDSMVFALANPEPEIMPELIMGKARIIATGRSDYPNQLNNVLCFPGLFRGALDVAATEISEDMKIAAARAIAESIPDDQLSDDYLLPSVFNPDVPLRVARAVAETALASGHVRPEPPHVWL
ncbi:MAG: NAD-dependent malic enzyme [Chloroflexota bacterium]